MGRLERHLDLDLIARLAAGNKHAPKPVKRVKEPRPADDYRCARRNAARGYVWKGVVPDGAIYRGPVRLNRSSKWRPIRRYADGPGGGRR